MKKRLVCLAAAILAAATGFAQTDSDIKPDGRGHHPRGFASRGAGTVVPITYHGGPVMLGTTHVYYIYYGNWAGTDPTGPAILQAYPSNTGGSPYFNINTTYYDSTNTHVSNSVQYVSSITSNYTAKTTLADGDIWGIVTQAFVQGMPQDPSGVYFVLTAPGIGESSGFLTQYCGWHTANYYNGQYYKYAFVGNASGPSLGNCAWQTGSSPNKDPGADAMVSVIAHELQEAVTDELGNAWYDTNGEENADKCAWTFGTTSYATNGSLYNVTMGSYEFLIQQNWVQVPNAGNCAMSYAGSTNPNYTLSVSPTSQSAVQGTTTGSYGVSVNPSNGYNGTVTLSAIGLPAGAVPTFTPVSTTSTSSLKIAVGSTVAAGTYPFTISGTDGTLTHTTSASLVVTSNGSFTISITPSSLTVRRGTSGRYTVTVTPSGSFNSSVALSVSGLPARVSGSFSPSSLASGNSTLTISVQSKASVTSGRTITVTGTGGGVTKTTTATLSIN